MSLVENVATLPQPRTGSYEFARFNALRHGVLVASHGAALGRRRGISGTARGARGGAQAGGPDLVEEVAGIIWRKRRLRLGESAAHHRALRHVLNPYQHTAEAALINATEEVEANCIGDSIRATDEQTAEEELRRTVNPT
jgi:hypothetical protein